MDVNVGELNSTIEAVSGDSILAPETLQRIVRAVLQALESQQAQQRSRASDLDMRSIVEQQRGGKR